MPRPLAIFLAATFLIAPFSVLAEEQQIPIPPEVPYQNTPIYFYISPNGTILGIQQITPDLLAGCEATLPDPTNPEISEEAPQTPNCFLLVPNQNQPATTEDSGEGVAESATLVQTLDYYPFGSLRANKQEGNFNEKKKLTGHVYDDSTGLSYMGARYQTGTEGRFLSQDPVFTEVGGNDFASKLQGSAFGSANVKNQQELIERYLATPQALNSYSYSALLNNS